MTDLVWVISSCVLIAAVIAVRAAFGKKLSAGLRYALWGLVLIRLLIPGTIFSSHVSVKSAMQNTEAVQNIEAVREVSAIARTDTGAVIGQLRRPAAQQNDAAPAQQEQSTAQQNASSQTAVVLSEATPERFERMQKTLAGRDIANIIWYTGMALAAAYFITANVRFYLKLRARRQRLEIDAGCPVYSVEGLNSSCLFLNSIYISKDNAEDPEKLAYVLAHEKAHRRHGDGVFALLRSAALVLHWYNPLVWIAAFLSRRDSELFADAGAIKAIGEEKREDYGRTLIELSSRRSVYAPIACAATMMTSGKRELKSRITNIAKRRKMGVIVCAVVLLLAAAAVGCTFLGGTMPDPDDGPLLQAAWAEAQKIAEVHGLDFDKKEHMIINSVDDYQTQIEFFSPNQKSPDAVIDLVLYGSDEDGWEVMQRLLMLKPDESIDEAKLASDLEAIRPVGFSVIGAELDEAHLGYDNDGTAKYAARWFCDTLTDMAFEGNYFRCLAAEPVTVSRISGGRTYQLTVVVRPENERAFTNGMGACIGQLLDGGMVYEGEDEPQHMDFDRCFTVTFDVNIVKKPDDSIEVEYVYPSIPSEDPQPTEAAGPTPIPDDAANACIDTARSIAEAVCLEHGITMDTENGELKRRRDGSYEVAYSSNFEGSDRTSAVIFVVFDEDITVPTVTNCTLERHDAPEVDYEKFMNELGYLDVTTRGRTYKIADIEDELGAPMTADGIAEKLGAYDLASIFCLLGNDNYFVCSDAEAVKLEKVNGDDNCGHYNVTVAMRPVNDAVFAAGFGDVLGPLWNAVPSEYVPEHSGFDYCYTITCAMQVRKTDDGSAFRIDYGYTWESFEDAEPVTDEWFVDEAWKLVQHINRLYGTDFAKDEGKEYAVQQNMRMLSWDRLDQGVHLKVEFRQNGSSEWVAGMDLVSFYYDLSTDRVDMEKYGNDIILLSGLELDLTADDLKKAGYSPDGGEGDLDMAAEYMANYVAGLFTDLPDGNYFKCSDAGVSRFEKRNSDSYTHTVNVALLPVDYSNWGAAYADIFAAFCADSEYYGYFTIFMNIMAVRNGDGSITVSLNWDE